MAIPIMPVNEHNELPDDRNQDISGLIPLMISPLTVLQDFIDGNADRGKIKDIWLKSEALEDGTFKIGSSISERDIWELKGRGLIEGDGRTVSLTDKGQKILREAILDDEQSSLTKEASLVKKASKKLISKNSYDFGNEVLVRTNKEKFGARYITVPKQAFKDKKASPREITEYNIDTRNDDNSYKNLKDYSEEELVQVLHLAKRIVSNRDLIMKKMAARGKLPQSIPVNRIKAFTTMIIEELNSR